MYTGPHIIKDGLVFGYDTGYGIADNDTATRFYPGEPTTNILPSPERNGRFTTSNNWYSYNTAQYNNNTYFSIGTVSSVTNNEVTLSSVSRTLYTYDVLRPQTTGGGVTAGTSYFVKKTGTNSFTLHTYNSNQNGSQGYIDPSTGAFKVHESIALDQRVSINSTSFPTMWHGAPHQPNMCYVKEVVSSGGPNDNSSFMRIHLTRPAGTDGGMAYGVSPAVTQGDVITVSFWTRSNIERAISYSTHFGGSAAGAFAFTPTSEWQRVEHTWTASVNYSFLQYFWPGNPGTVPYYVDLADIQVEVNKGHSTPLTLTSRSSTASLIDLKGTTDIDVSNVSFDSTGQPEFDGTDDRINMGDTSFTNLSTSNFTIEAVLYIPSDITTNTGHYKGVVVKKGASGANAGMGIYYNTGHEKFLWSTANGSSSVERFTTNTFGSLLGTYIHVVMIRDSSATNNGHFYINGVQEAISSGGSLMNVNNNYNLLVGASSTLYSNYFLEGNVPVAKIYSRALTAEEALQNYNAYKNRFSI